MNNKHIETSVQKTHIIMTLSYLTDGYKIKTICSEISGYLTPHLQMSFQNYTIGKYISQVDFTVATVYKEILVKRTILCSLVQSQ